MSDSIADIAKKGIASFNDADWTAAAEIWAADGTYDEKSTGRVMKGIEEIIASQKGWKAAFPDAHGEISSIDTNDNTATVQLHWKGTHTGPMQSPKGEIPATNKEVNVAACIVMKFKGGKVVHEAHYFDMMTMLAQLGLAG